MRFVPLRLLRHLDELNGSGMQFNAYARRMRTAWRGKLLPTEDRGAEIYRESRGELARCATPKTPHSSRWCSKRDGLLCSVQMDQVEIRRTKQIRCDGCGQLTPSYNIFTYGSAEQGHSRQLCSLCFNKEVAKRDGLDRFEDAKFEPVGLVDCTGEAHEFHFRTYLFGPGVALDAFELRDGHPAGYQFKLIGDPEDDLLVGSWGD